MNDVPGVSNGGAPSQWTAYKLLKDPQIKNGDVWGDRNCYILDGGFKRLIQYDHLK